ncbi:hydrogenase maturation protease [Chlorobaculum sp. 24CR]|uniref:HyaD/HybD family hydrogenase maturation endopeptidase n=1 Tax=Chlorobaculum sp. 24CR TaxID=2508878 RepID=UPI00100BC023|nr:HyaD/HybD family hydrogenase maturation endopeptidase [Chlorobaculum sp. 24CR]RXK88485.1 hydrogenase maturation protease [Chlorobaculum sp. 24CR]
MKTINVVGLGNILFGDEGFGVEAVRALEASGKWPEAVQFVDGGTQGLYLLDYFESCDALMVFDSIIPAEFEPKVYCYRNGELPAFIHRKMSAHQMGLSELLAVARLHGREPSEIVLIGAPPHDLGLGNGLSEPMLRHLAKAVETGREVLRKWLEK